MLCGFYWLYQWSKNYALSYLRLYLHINDQHTHEKIFGTALSFLFVCLFVCLSIRVFFTDNDDSQDSRGREEIIFYSTLLLPPTHKHWDIYLQLCIWYDYHVFLIATLVFSTRWELPPYRVNIWVIHWWCNVCMFTWWIDTRFLLHRFDIGNRWIWTRIDHHPCIKSEPTNQVC